VRNNSDQNIKITLICPQYPPEKGAAASRMAKLAEGLLSRNVTVDVITALPNYPTGRIFPGYRGKLWYSESIDGITVKRYWLYASNSANASKRILNMISLSATMFFSLRYLIRNRPTIIVVNSPPLTVGLTGVFLAKFLRARVITNVSDIWPMTALELGSISKGRLYSLLEKIETYLYRCSDAIMTQSEETRRHVLAQFPDKKTFLYRNLDYTSVFASQYPTMQTKPRKIVYAGLLGVAQGVYEISKQIDFRSAEVEFHIYGDGNERVSIEQYIKKNPDCNVFLHRSVPKIDMPEILSQFHATIIPLKTNLTGAFPSKIFMAISASLPVLFCGSGEGAQFVKDSKIGWVTDPGDFRGLSRRVKSLATMPDLEYQSLRKRIASLARSEYDLEDQLNRLLAFINKIK
jgi:glycosyltransferase involved in cell wall biosynthesis